jgi:chromosomal replication initiation ATPase DnaA
MTTAVVNDVSASIIVTSANRRAYDVLQLLVDESAGACNPVVLCGPSGVGKTALLEQMVADIARRSSARSVVVCTTESCVQTLFDSVRIANSRRWKDAMLAADVLVVDNAEILDGKPLVQSEIAFAVRARVHAGKPTVVAITGGPHRAPVLVDYLRRLCKSPVFVEVHTPRFRDRLEFVKESAAQRSLTLTARAATAVARSCETPADIVTTLHHLAFYSEQWHEPITEPLARWVLARLGRPMADHVRIARN